MARGPVKHTCPDIDSVISSIKEAYKAAEDGKSEAEYRSSIWYNFDTIIDNLYRLDDKLEELRTSNDALRSWGSDQEDKVHELENQVYELETKLNELL